MSGFGFLIEVLSNVAKFFFDVINYSPFASGGKVFTGMFDKELLEPLSEITSTNIYIVNGVCNLTSFENWDSLGNTITRFNNETGGSSCSIK